MKNRGGITSPDGFLSCGYHVGFKKKRKDMALVWSEVPATFAGVFTTNVAKAAPVQWNQTILNIGKAVKGVLINSGQANACTGDQGSKTAEAMAQKVASTTGCAADEILLASTGIIGVQIPLDIAEKGIEKLATKLNASSFSAACAAEAIMTTDTCIKQFSIEISLGGKTVTLGAMAKGSGMIHPNMATMLSFISTDANISQALLQKALSQSVAKTYNMISVDGDTSTNDMVIVMANGLAGNAIINDENADYYTFAEALDKVNTHLAKAIASDGEGASKLLTVTVGTAGTEADACKLAKAVVASSLVKAALFAGDPNWGRIAAALGYAGVDFDLSLVSIGYQSKFGDVTVMHGGESTAYDESLAGLVLSAPEVELHVNMNAGIASATAWGCDLSYDYVRINATYKNVMPVPQQFAEVG